jgi:hydroxymethylpyrimidine pyrophosphatase-like HAD family hydrolase
MHYLALATDYDGTLAHDGHVDDATLGSLRRLRASGRKVILVTGRELPDLQAVFPGLALCDVAIAENGAVLYEPADDREEVLGEPPSPEFIAEMTRLDVTPCSVGRVIFATWRPHEKTILETIQRMGSGHQIIFNKRAVMVLPGNLNKATGLTAALARLEIAPEQVVGVGDAENDHVFLDACGFAAAVDNALPALKERCDLVLAGDHGRGVRELIDLILETDLQHLGPRRPRTKIAAQTIRHER